MKKLISTTFAILFATTATTTFTSCDNNNVEEPNQLTIIATDVDGEVDGITLVNAVYINTVGFINFGEGADSGGGTLADEGTPAATANFINRGFLLSVPLELTDVTLATVNKADLENYAEMSVESFKMTQLQFEGFKGEQRAGLICRKSKDQSIESVLFYSDAALTIKGDGKAENGTEYVYNMTILKGWNMYFIKTETIPESGEGEAVIAEHKKYTVQTTDFSGITYTWYYNADVQ